MNRACVRVALLAAALAATLVIGVATGRYYAGGWALLFVTTSPDRTEQLEFYAADRWHSRFGRHADMPGFVRLTRRPGGETVATSDTFDLSGQGEAFWTKEGVQIGTSAAYDRATGRWTLLP